MKIFSAANSRPKRSPDRPTRRRRAVSGFEPLEERCVLSTAQLHPLHHAFALHRSAHAAAVAAPAAASAFQVQWSFPANGQVLGGGPGFVAVSFTQLPNGQTATAQNVQLAHHNADGSWSVVPDTIWVNPGNNTVVIAPTGLQPNGVYVVALYGGLQSVTGASIGGPIYLSFSINDNWGATNPITVFPSNNGDTGVIVADQSRALDPSSVNGGTVQVYASNGAPVPVTIVYDPNIPSIELALQTGLTAGTYYFVEHGVRDAAGNVLTSNIAMPFTITQNQVAPGPDVLQNTPIAVADSYPHNGDTVFATPITSVTFNQAPDPTTVNNNTVQLVRWLPDQNRWSNPLPISVTLNNLHSAIIIPTAGLELGNYLIAVNGVKDQLGRTMSGPTYIHYTFTHDTFYPVDPRNFHTFPAGATVYNGTPPAILVFLNKFAGDQASSINPTNVQLVPWLGNHFGNPLPVGVAYNPWPGLIVMSPFFSIGDGTYVIVVNGVTDLAGNIQNWTFSTWFGVTGTGRPQSA